MDQDFVPALWYGGAKDIDLAMVNAFVARLIQLNSSWASLGRGMSCLRYNRLSLWTIHGGRTMQGSDVRQQAQDQ
jgi:hypothetical protein